MQNYAVVVIPADAVEGLIEFLDEHDVFDAVVDALLDVTMLDIEEASDGFCRARVAEIAGWDTSSHALSRLDAYNVETSDPILQYTDKHKYDGWMPTRKANWYYEDTDGRKHLAAGDFMYRPSTEILVRLGNSEALREQQIRMLAEID